MLGLVPAGSVPAGLRQLQRGAVPCPTLLCQGQAAAGAQVSLLTDHPTIFSACFSSARVLPAQLPLLPFVIPPALAGCRESHFTPVSRGCAAEGQGTPSGVTLLRATPLEGGCRGEGCDRSRVLPLARNSPRH